MTKSRGILQPRHRWSDDDIALLTRLYPDTPTIDIAKQLGASIDRVYKKANSIGLRKSSEYMNSPAACRLRRGDNVGAASRFQKGHVTWNKGVKGIYIGGIATQFKPGRAPSEASNYKPIGSVRLSKDNYLECKVSDDQSVSPARRWIGMHRLVWEKVNGPIPAGHAVVFRKGMRTTNQHEITVDRLELISRADLMRRNTVHNYPPEIAKLVQLRGALIRQINHHQEKESI